MRSDRVRSALFQDAAAHHRLIRRARLRPMRTRTAAVVLAGLLPGMALCGCGNSGGSTPSAAGQVSVSVPPVAGSGTTTDPSPSPSSASPSPSPSPKPAAAPFRAGNPNGRAAVPAAAQAVNTSHPTRVVGKGTASSCTSAAVVSAVAAGGIITFDCGPDPVVIAMAATAKVRNTSSQVVIDGGGKVTLSGGGKRRILYMDTCDQAQGWTTSHCQDQSTPRLTVQNLTLADGNATGQLQEGGGGGAMLVRGGQLKVVNSRFLRNRCDTTGPDLGGAAIRDLSQWSGAPVYIVGSTFGGASGQGGSCSNGGALSSIGVSWDVINSLMAYNTAVGHGANPARSGTPGGGSGGAIYNDGNTFTLTLQGTVVEHNHANEGGGAIFYVSNDLTGTLTIQNSTLSGNPSDEFHTAGYPGIFYRGSGRPRISDSTLS
jgi:hypothetical protein